MIYFKRFFLLLLITLTLSACQHEKEDEDDDEKSMQLHRAQTAFAEGDYETSVRLLLPLAYRGDSDAQYALGYAFYEGLGVPQDRMQAYFWIQESALQGNSHAMLALEIFEIEPNLPMDEVGDD